MQETSRAKCLAYCAVCIALAFLLNQVSLFRMPQGGSITPASMLFIVLAGYWLGPVYGILAGVSKGLLDTITGAAVLHPVQYVLDYLLAFGMLGLSGFFRKMNFGLQIGYIVGVLGRYVMVVASGAIFWATMAGLEGAEALVFSLVYNITYIGPEAVVTLVLISLPSVRYAINSVTRTVVPHDYPEMSKNWGSVTQTARLVTGGVVGAVGGFAFVVASYIARVEGLAITHYVTGTRLFTEEPTRVYRMIERNTEQIFALQTVGVLLLAVGVTLVVSTLAVKNGESAG